MDQTGRDDGNLDQSAGNDDDNIDHKELNFFTQSVTVLVRLPVFVLSC